MRVHGQDYRTIFVADDGVDRRGDRPDAPAVRLRAAPPRQRRRRGRRDPRHGGARRAADRRDRRLRRGARDARRSERCRARPRRATARRDPSHRGEPALGAVAHAVRACEASRPATAWPLPTPRRAHRRRGRGRLRRHRTARLRVARATERRPRRPAGARAHALQCRLAGLRGLGHGARAGVRRRTRRASPCTCTWTRPVRATRARRSRPSSSAPTAFRTP